MTLARIALCLAAAGDRPAVRRHRRRCSGTPEYAAQFRQWADQWQAAAEKAGAESIRIGLSAAGRRHRSRPIAARSWPRRPTAGTEPLWIVLIGHGTFDGREAKFNLRGPDVTDVELAEWLAPIKRPVVVIDCASASGPFLNRLSGDNRVVVTATKSGYEMNFARFGQYLAEAIDRPARRPRQGRPGLAPGGVPDRQQPGRGVLPHAFATGHRARAARRQRRPAGNAGQLVSRRPRDPARQGRRRTRRHPGPPDCT